VIDSHTPRKKKNRREDCREKEKKGREKMERRRCLFLKKKLIINAKSSFLHVLGILDDCRCRIDKQ